jgi:hypothetical protein
MNIYSGFAGFGSIGIIFFVFLAVAMIGIVVYNGMHKKRPLEKKESNFAYKNKGKKKKK